MTRHRKPKRRAARFESLIVVNAKISPTVGVVERLQLATAEAVALAQAKRDVERALRTAGMPKSAAVRVVSHMVRADVLAEAAKLAPLDLAQAPAATPAPSTPSRPWWRFWSSP